MNDLEHLLKTTLREKSAEVDRERLDAGRILQRARRRRAAAGGVLVCSLLLLGFVGLRALPAPTPPKVVEVVSAPTTLEGQPMGPGPINVGDHPRLACYGDFTRDCLPFASGRHWSNTWIMYLYKSDSRIDEHGPREAWCSGLEYDSAGGGGCPASLPDGVFVATGRGTARPGKDEAVTGRLAPEVARVEIRVRGFEPFDVPIIEGPPLDDAEDPRVKYFLAFVPVDSDVEVAVFDADGVELESSDVPRMMELDPKDLDDESD